MLQAAMQAAMEAALKAQQLVWTSISELEEAEYHFYGALAQAACYSNSGTADEREQRLDCWLFPHY